MFCQDNKGIDLFEEFFESKGAVRYPTPMPSFNMEEFVTKLTESDHDMHGNDDGEELEYIVKQNVDNASVNAPMASRDMYMKLPRGRFIQTIPKHRVLTQPMPPLPLPPPAVFVPPSNIAAIQYPSFNPQFLPTWNQNEINGVHTSSLPSLVFRFKMGYSEKIGGFGVADSQFTEPSGIAITAEGDIVVADTNNHRIQVFDSECKFKFAFGAPGKLDGQLLYPNRVAISPINGDFVITERSPTHQVQIFDRFGIFIRKFGTNVLQHPRGVCVDSEGRIIIVECKLMRVCIFSSNGTFLHKFSALEYLMFPNSICVGPRNELFICDNRAHQVKVFNYNGNYLRAIGGPGVTNFPISVSVNRMGHVMVVDNHNKFNLTIFDNNGKILSAYESKVRHAHCFDAAVYNGLVVVASKDYKVYYYHFERSLNEYNNQKPCPAIKATTVDAGEKKECDEEPPPSLSMIEKCANELIPECTDPDFIEQFPNVGRLSSTRNSSSSSVDEVEDTEPVKFSVLPPPTLFRQASIFRSPMGYSARFGGYGIINGQFTEPSGIVISPNGDIVVADTNNHRIQVFDSECVFKFAFGEPGKRDGQLLYPNRVAINPFNGNFVVTERSPTHQVQIFNRFGIFIRKFGTNILQQPRGVCIDSDGNIIVVECKLMRVCIFSEMGVLLHKFSAIKHLMFPNNICVGPGNELYICDNREHCIKVFNYNGDYLRSIGGEGITNYPISVSIDHLGRVLVADNHNKFNLTIFDKNGKLLSAYESKVRHAHCFDAAVFNGVIVVASKDYKVYYYNFKMFDKRQPPSYIMPSSQLQPKAAIHRSPAFPTSIQFPSSNAAAAVTSMPNL